MSLPENLSGCRIVDAELKPGEKVVIEGLQKIRDGMNVAAKALLALEMSTSAKNASQP